MDYEKDILLEAEGFQTLFEVSEERDNFLKTRITLSFLTDSNRGSFQTQNNSIDRKDLLRLAEYFEKHISNLKSDCNYESQTFVTQELAFQTKAFCGEIRDNSDGEFTISFMLNIGFDKTGSTVYAGCEGMIVLEKAQNFIDSISQTLNK